MTAALGLVGGEYLSRNNCVPFFITGGKDVNVKRTAIRVTNDEKGFNVARTVSTVYVNDNVDDEMYFFIY